MDLLSSISEFFVSQRHQLVQSLPYSIVIVLISTYTASALLVHRNHPTPDLIVVQDQLLTGKQQCATLIYLYALKPATQLALMDLFSSIRGFFVGQRHQLVQFLPSFFAIALISTFSASALHLHLHYPTFDLIEVQVKSSKVLTPQSTKNKARA
jgi:hypothetical protein